MGWKRRVKHIIAILIATILNVYIYREALKMGLPLELGVALLILLYILEQSIASIWHDEHQ